MMVDLLEAIVIVIVYDFYFINKIRYKAKTIVRNCSFRNAGNNIQPERMTTHRQTRWHTNFFLIDQKVCCGF